MPGSTGWVRQQLYSALGAELLMCFLVVRDRPRVAHHDLVEQRTLGSADDGPEYGPLLERNVHPLRASLIADRDSALEHADDMVALMPVALDHHLGVVASIEAAALRSPLKIFLSDRDAPVAVHLGLDLIPLLLVDMTKGQS